MSDKAKLWFFILLLPILAALGGDLYINYYENEENRAQLESLNIDPETFQGSDFGYLFTTYLPDFFFAAREAVGAENWVKFVDPVLQLYTVVVAAIPLGIFLVWLFISKILEVWPFTRSPVDRAALRGRRGSIGKQTGSMLNSRDTESRFKYKRR